MFHWIRLYHPAAKQVSIANDLLTITITITTPQHLVSPHSMVRIPVNESRRLFSYTFHIIAFVCSSLSAIYTFVKLYLFINAPQWQGCFRVCVVGVGILVETPSDMQGARI